MTRLRGPRRPSWEDHLRAYANSSGPGSLAPALVTIALTLAVLGWGCRHVLARLLESILRAIGAP